MQGKESLADERRSKLAEGSRSDHIMLARAYSGWERAVSRGTDRQYCWDNFLAAGTLRVSAICRL